MSSSYARINSGINFGTEFLTEVVAYFLGGIITSNESVQSAQGSKYHIAAFRYNPGGFDRKQLTEHFEIVRELGKRVCGQTQPVDQIRNTKFDNGKNRLDGFLTFFEESSPITLEQLIDDTSSSLSQSAYNVIRSFLVGVFDGKGYFDRDLGKGKIRYLCVDCVEEIIGTFLCEFVQSHGYEVNYNISRDRKEGGPPRKSQLRIKNADLFMSQVGLISPIRINHAKEAYRRTHSVNVISEDNVLQGLKTFSLR